MTAIICLILLAAAIPTAVWLKREGEREWARHRVRTATVTLTIGTTAFAAAMAKMVRAAADVERSMRKVGESIDMSSYQLDSMRAANLRVLKHEIETPTRGHDLDGACCRRAEAGEDQ